MKIITQTVKLSTTKNTTCHTYELSKTFCGKQGHYIFDDDYSLSG